MSNTKTPYYAAQAILARRAHSESEMRQKLAKKGFLQEEVDETVSRLFKENLLNDGEYARVYIRSSLAAKPTGPRWLFHKLKERGVDEGMIQEALSELVPQEQEYVLAIEATKKWKRIHAKHAADPIRLSRYLAGRGFSYEVISSITTRDS